MLLHISSALGFFAADARFVGDSHLSCGSTTALNYQHS